jgi:hypothetical protein
MTLSRKIAAALDETTRAHNLPCLVTAEDGPNRITLDVAALDAVGVAFDALEFATTDRADWSSPSLAAWGDRLAKRVTYLMEPLRVLEVDAGGGEVQIRSASATPRAETRSYYEVRLNRQGTCRLERYAYDESNRRRHRIACHLTREVVERLADDIAASAAAV